MSILLVRHGSAGDPYHWSGDDADRPLDASGRDQADRLPDAVGPVLSGRPLAAIRSSRALRCIQTVSPLATRHGLAASTDPALFEGGSSPTTELVRRLAARREADRQVVVLCSHSDVIPEVVRDVVADGAGLTGGRGCAYASVWELTVTDGVVTHAHYHQ
ncbi:MAG: phosphoglycerate mutase family protein [Actinomycetota bacterium]|nr:phosphoglycerate mutase family protein [Actinomycetota bacterium]